MKELTGALNAIRDALPDLDPEQYRTVMKVVADVYEKAWRHGADFAARVQQAKGGQQ